MELQNHDEGQEEQQSSQQHQEHLSQWMPSPRLVPGCQICGEKSKRLFHNCLDDPTSALLCEPCWKHVQVKHDQLLWKKTPMLVRLLFSIGFLLVCALTTFALATIADRELFTLVGLCVVLALLLELLASLNR
jgi:hypothetical protein